MKNKKITKGYSEDQVTVILEDMRDQFRAFAEGQDVLTEKVDGLANDLEKVANDVVDIKHSLARKVDMEDFQKLEKRVIKLEKAIA